MTSAPPFDRLATSTASGTVTSHGRKARAAAAVVPFLAARVVVLGAFGLAAFLHAHAARSSHLESLLGWDADWYRRIAAHGYGHLPHEALRFFPAFPELARALAPAVGGTGTALLVISNGAALLYGYLLYRLARQEGLGHDAARRAVWVAAFAPAAFVLVMGYAEALSGCLLVGVMLAVRSRRWLAAAPLGAVLAATRPTGVLVVVLVAIEAGRGLPGCGLVQLGQRLLAVIAPVAGIASYLWWVGARFGDSLAPFHVQVQSQLRGGLLIDPRHALRAAVTSPSVSDLHPETLHLAWLLVSVALVAVCARRLPASFTAYAGALVLLGATARAFTSFERYSGAAVPLLLAAALVLRTRRWQALALATAPAGMAGYALMASLHLYIP